MTESARDESPAGIADPNRNAPDATGAHPLRDNLGDPEVGQVILPATPGGSPATGEWQVNVPLTRNNDLPYGFLVPADSFTDPGSPAPLPG